ncbi:VPS13-like protein [Cryptosporidium canis]|uniref:VPS13-like protein n=1 Tax=Cryptosporidium canis TaxID=195482 RepID=A0ABQ8P1Z3_9CRYT|nr:VPS13-like protein [Cryptosporidium canis]
MSLRELVVGSTQMLVESVLRRINENLLNYFINLPESIWLSGFLDQVNLKDVMFNTRAFTNEWYSLDIPFRLKYGHIRRASIQVLLAHSKLVMEAEGVVIIVGPNLAYKSYEDVIRNSMDNVFGLVELFKHIQNIRYNKDSFGETLGSQKDEMSDNIFNMSSSSKEGLNALLRWLFRYVPDLSLSIRNLYIRYEDDVLDTSHPMSAGIHIDSVTINPARNCWEFQWPTEEKEQVGFVSKGVSDLGTDPVAAGRQQHPLAISNSSADPRGIFSIKVKGLSAFWDDESAPFIPISLLEQTEASSDKFGVFSAVTIDDIQNLVNSNLQYHTRIISNLNVSAQFGFVNPFIQRTPSEGSAQDGGDSGQKSTYGPASSYDSSSSASKNANGEKSGYIQKDYLSDYYTGSNIATLLNVNVHSGLEINVYPQMIHGLVRFVTLYNQFQFWTQVRRFRPIERPGSGKTPAEVRAICRDWWIFSLKYYRNIKYKDNKHNSLKDEINYRIERKRYIKIIKKWKWVEFMITGQKPVSDSGTIIHKTGTSDYNACSFRGEFGAIPAGSVEEYVKGMGSSISFLDSSLSSALGLGSQMIGHLTGSFNLSRYWQYDVEVLQKVSEKSEDVRCILAVLQHHTYWVVSQWHVLAEREFEIEFALLQNSSTSQKRYSGAAADTFSGVEGNMDTHTKNNLTLLAYGLHIQAESSVWELISELKRSYSGLIRRISQDEGLSRCIRESLHSKSSLLNGGSVFELGLTSGISAGVPTQISSLIQENVERHPYVVFGSGIFKRGSLETEILSDFFGVALGPRPTMTKRDWHAIRLRLHLWGRFYDEYFEAFPLAISETVEISQMMNLSYHLDFQQMNKLFSISMQSDSLCFSSLLSSQSVVSSPMEEMGISMGPTNVTVARPKSQNLLASERGPERKSPSSSINRPERMDEGRGGIIRHSGELDETVHQVPKSSGQDISFSKERKDHSGKESNELAEDDNVSGNGSSTKKSTFMFEKKLPYVYNDSSSVPEWLSDLAGPGIALPKIISNKIIGICVPSFEVNICHLVSGGRRSSGSGVSSVSVGGGSAGASGSSSSVGKEGGGSKRIYHSLAKYFKDGHSSNPDISTSAFTTRKLFGVVLTGLGFNMSTCTSLRMSSCFRRMEVVVWNYNDSNLMREFITSIKLDKTVSSKMIRDDQIVIFSLCGERHGIRNVHERGDVSGIGSGSRSGDALDTSAGGLASSHTESTSTEGGDGSKTQTQTPNRRSSSNLNEYDSSPSLTHYVDEAQSGTFSSSMVGGGRRASLQPTKTVRFEDSRVGVSGADISITSSSFEALRISGSDLGGEISQSHGTAGVRSDHPNTLTIPAPSNASSNMNGIGRYMRRWNYMSLVVLPPNNSSVREKKGGDLRGGGDSSLSFVFKLPFYLKMDINLTSITVILNEQLLDNIRGEIMKLVQVCLLTIWSQYKGLGAFPVTNTIWELVQEGAVRNNSREENSFELLLCHPFNLSLNKYNSLNRMNTAEWNRINSLLNKVHARISLRLPSMEVYMLNESIEYFHQMEEDLPVERDAEGTEKNISFDLSTSFKLLVEPQTILIGTIIDKQRGNINRLYFRGFQMKFDTQQNITSIIRLYLRFKNLILDRYGNIIAIMNLFKDYKFDLISRHSLTSFTDEILRLQCEKLPDTNNILLKEFTLSLDERPEFESQREDKELKASEPTSSAKEASHVPAAQAADPAPSVVFSPSLTASPSASPSQIVSPALSVYSSHPHPHPHTFGRKSDPEIPTVSSDSPIASESKSHLSNQLHIDREKRVEVDHNLHSSRNGSMLRQVGSFEDQAMSGLKTVHENVEIRRKSSKLVLMGGTEALGREEGQRSERPAEPGMEVHSGKKNASLVSLRTEAVREKDMGPADGEAIPQKNGQESTGLQHRQQHIQKKKPPISLRSGFNFNN